jgi:hypothetical protein
VRQLNRAWRLAEEMPSEKPYCVEGCGNIALYESLVGLASDGTEIVELKCYDCKEKEGESND